MECATQSPFRGAIHPCRVMSIERAAHLYERLRPFLRVVDGWGCHPVDYGKRKSVRRGYRTGDYSGIRNAPPGCTSQTWVVWNPTRGRPVTFAEFLRVYNIETREE